MKSIVWSALLAITALAAPQDEIKRLEDEIKYAIDIATKLAESSKKIDFACKRLGDDMGNLDKLGANDQEALKVRNEMMPLLLVCTRVSKEYDELNKIASKVIIEHSDCINALVAQKEQEAKILCERSREHFVELERLVGPNTRIFSSSDEVVTNADTAILRINETITRLNGVGAPHVSSSGSTSNGSGPEIVLSPPVVVVEESKDDVSEHEQTDSFVSVSKENGPTTENGKDESFPFAIFPQVDISSETAKIGESGKENEAFRPAVPQPLPLYIRQDPIFVMPQDTNPLKKTGLLDQLVDQENVVPETPKLSAEVPQASVAKDTQSSPTGFDSPQSQDSGASTDQEHATSESKIGSLGYKSGRQYSTKELEILTLEFLKCNKIAFGIIGEVNDRMNVLKRVGRKIREDVEESENIVASATSNKEALEKLLDSTRNVHAEFQREYEQKYKMLEQIHTKSTEIHEKTAQIALDKAVSKNVEALVNELYTMDKNLELFNQYLHGQSNDAREYANVTLAKIEAIVQDIKSVSTSDVERGQEGPESSVTEEHTTDDESSPFGVFSKDEVTQETNDESTSDNGPSKEEEGSPEKLQDKEEQNAENTSISDQNEEFADDTKSTDETVPSTEEDDAQKSTISENKDSSGPSPKEQLIELQRKLRENALYAKQVGDQMKELVKRVKVAVEKAREFATSSGHSPDEPIADLITFEHQLDGAELVASRTLGQIYVISNTNWHNVNEFFAGKTTEDAILKKIEEIKDILERHEYSLRNFYTDYLDLDARFKVLEARMNEMVDGFKGNVDSMSTHSESSQGTPASSLRGYSLRPVPIVKEQSGSLQPHVPTTGLDNAATIDGKLREHLASIATNRMDAVAKYEKAGELYGEFTMAVSNVPGSRDSVEMHNALANNMGDVDRFYHNIITNSDTVRKSIGRLLEDVENCGLGQPDVEIKCEEAVRNAVVALEKLEADKSNDAHLENMDRALAVIQPLVGMARGATNVHEQEQSTYLEKLLQDKFIMLVDLPTTFDTVRNISASSPVAPPNFHAQDEPTGGMGHIHVEQSREHIEQSREHIANVEAKNDEKERGKQDDPAGNSEPLSENFTNNEQRLVKSQEMAQIVPVEQEKEHDPKSSGFKVISCILIALIAVMMQF